MIHENSGSPRAASLEAAAELQTSRVAAVRAAEQCVIAWPSASGHACQSACAPSAAAATSSAGPANVCTTAPARATRVLAAIQHAHAAIRGKRLEHEQRAARRDAGERHRRSLPAQIEVVIPEAREVALRRCERDAALGGVRRGRDGFGEAAIEHEQLEA